MMIEPSKGAMTNPTHSMKMLEAIQLVKQQILPYRTLMTYYTCAMMEIETKLKVLNEEFSLREDRNPIESIKTRLKSVDSIAEKLLRLNLPIDLVSMEQNLNDIAGIRVICSFPQDVYDVAEALARQDDLTVLACKDYIAQPKENGYRSLHMIVQVPIFLENEKRPVKAEIQLRTIAMDFWASLEHQLSYKKELPPDQEEALQQELRLCAEQSAELDRRMEKIRHTILTAR